ncbi:leishmanolysin-related zinc metalloendopeptidase [Alteromonas portus]|uniref:leishmanolysin-related zinc metalloendopeptidase n=1 Tax=Alteromonas portus TaxID=2565549 RepID=UPI003BF8FA7D
MKGLPKLVLSVVVSLSMSLPSHAGLFNISINNLGGLTPSQSSAFDDAIAYWETYLTGVQSVFDHSIVIDASGTSIDGVGGILGSAGPTSITQLADSPFVYANKGRMRFDTADLSNMENSGTLFDVIVHEMAHVIGFGTLWTTDFFIAGSQSNYVTNSGRYTGEYALEIYRQEFVEDAEFIPVELGGGAGTANSHWDEPWPGGSSDLMTGYLGPYPITLSDTTVASFADIGYLTNVTHSVSEATTVWLFLLSIGLVVIRHRQDPDIRLLKLSSMNV